MILSLNVYTRKFQTVNFYTRGLERGLPLPGLGGVLRSVSSVEGGSSAP